jgi:SAM-dependent methyltransferase
MSNKIQHSGSILTSANGFDIIDCIQCGFKHINPIPTEEELEHIYKHEYYIKDKPDYIEKDIQDKEWWEMTYHHRFEVFESHLSVERRKLLDIGSGPGLFLETGNQRKWITEGVEPNDKAAEHCIKRGLDVKNIMYNSETSKMMKKFDVVNLSLVLEHIANPTEMIKQVYEQLTDGGLVCIVVPNDYNPFQLVLNDHLGFKSWWVSPPHHINYFNFDSLSNLLERCGFEVVHKESTFPIDLFLLMGDNYIDNNELGRVCHNKRVKFEMAMKLSGSGHILDEFYSGLSKMNIGREVVIYAIKNRKETLQ